MQPAALFLTGILSVRPGVLAHPNRRDAGPLQSSRGKKACDTTMASVAPFTVAIGTLEQSARNRKAMRNQCGRLDGSVIIA